ncbi:deoxyribonuclease IV [Anaerovorax odorimutans]|uniref:Probable endonuclease 4 n=1 Tax=Anaerovorax odorimutans TaxID=109327 RepID=A0ABT1RKA3_9FIRM|nr:deoxyribonuclease IV [Anaerovorax odorimutans]MCQ4635623.1 deoxyribonuclease IV [Anaerovorax odorimutans]
MLTIGCHLSAAKGYENMGKDALKIGANTFAFFTRNPRGGKAKAIDQADVDRLLTILKENDFGKLVAHAPYTLNPCSKDPKVRNFAFMAMSEDMERMEYTPGNYYNFHPGSHVGQGVEEGIRMIAELLNQILKPEQSTIVLLETMAGKGSEVGSRFEELAEIIERVELKDKVGVCMDSCHVSDAGYDIIHDLDGVLDEFDRVIGLEKLHAMHINDSQNPLGAHKDRHAKIGEGHLGVETIAKIVNHPKLKELPFILETPNELDGYAREIAMLRGA